MERLVFDPARPDLGGNLHYGDANTFAPRLWRYLVERFGVSSVLDVTSCAFPSGPMKRRFRATLALMSRAVALPPTYR